MKHLKKYNENIGDIRYHDRLSTIRSVESLAKKLVKDAKLVDTDLDYLLDLIKDEWNKSEMPKEKPTFTTLSPEEKEKMMSDALKLSEEQWMKKYQVGDHGDYLRMAKSKWGLDESLSNKRIEVKDTWVSMEDYDEYIQPTLNVVTKDGKKFYVSLKSFDDFDDE